MVQLPENPLETMSGNLSPEPEDEGKTGKEKPKRRKRTLPHEADDHNDLMESTKYRRINGIILANMKPSYCLQRGVGSLQPRGGSLRSQHRKRLRLLLKKLLRKQNWVDASGVLSVLLKGTTREKSISRNRLKYWTTMEILQRIKDNKINWRKIQNVYDLWMKKLGPMRGRPTKDRFAAQLEYVLFCLTHGNTEDAYQGALCLMQERGFESDAVSNLVVGLTYCQLWYSTIPKELQLGELSKLGSPMQSEMSSGRIYMSTENSDGHDAVEAQGTNISLECDSNTSVGNEKDNWKMDADQNRDDSMVLDDKQQRETPYRRFHAQDFYINTSERSGHEEFYPNHNDEIPTASIFYTRGLPPWLLPLQLPHSTENLEDLLYIHRNLLNDNYKNAIKYLRVALCSEPPVVEAFHPLIQMLLLGDEVEEALNEVKNFSHNLDTALHLRLKTSLLEAFDRGNCVKLSARFEDILKKDPTCNCSLAKLVCMHQSGDYSTEKLVEMIALHLDATFADCNTWKELVSGLFKLSYCEGDQMSTCLEKDEDEQKRYSDHVKQVPQILTDPKTQCSWRLRCRWWQTRHFSQKTFMSDIAAGEMQLVTYKAAAASYLYGREFRYIVEATKHLERENNKDMLFLLRTHTRNSVGFYLTLSGRT